MINIEFIQLLTLFFDHRCFCIKKIDYKISVNNWCNMWNIFLIIKLLLRFIHKRLADQLLRRWRHDEERWKMTKDISTCWWRQFSWPSPYILRYTHLFQVVGSRIIIVNCAIDKNDEIASIDHSIYLAF